MCTHGYVVFTKKKHTQKKAENKIIAHTNDIGKLGDEKGEVWEWRETTSKIKLKKKLHRERQRRRRRRWQQQQQQQQ